MEKKFELGELAQFDFETSEIDVGCSGEDDFDHRERWRREGPRVV